MLLYVLPLCPFGAGLVVQNVQRFINTYKTKVQYCAKVIRAKCTNFILCLWELSKKVRTKIQVSFCNVLSIISFKQKTKIHGIFKTRTTIPYQRDNSAYSMQNIAVQCADQYRVNDVLSSCEQSRSS